MRVRPWHLLVLVPSAPSLLWDGGGDGGAFFLERRGIGGLERVIGEGFWSGCFLGIEGIIGEEVTVKGLLIMDGIIGNGVQVRGLYRMKRIM